MRKEYLNYKLYCYLFLINNYISIFYLLIYALKNFKINYLFLISTFLVILIVDFKIALIFIYIIIIYLNYNNIKIVVNNIDVSILALIIVIGNEFNFLNLFRQSQNFHFAIFSLFYLNQKTFSLLSSLIMIFLGIYLDSKIILLSNIVYLITNRYGFRWSFIYILLIIAVLIFDKNRYNIYHNFIVNDAYLSHNAYIDGYARFGIIGILLTFFIILRIYSINKKMFAYQLFNALFNTFYLAGGGMVAHNLLFIRKENNYEKDF